MVIIRFLARTEGRLVSARPEPVRSATPKLQIINGKSGEPLYDLGALRLNPYGANICTRHSVEDPHIRIF